MRAADAAVATVKIGELACIRAANRFAVNQKVDDLKVVVVEHHVLVSARGSVHDRVYGRVVEAIVVQRMRIEGGEMIDPDAVGSEQTRQFTDERTATAVANEVQ